MKLHEAYLCIICQEVVDRDYYRAMGNRCPCCTEPVMWPLSSWLASPAEKDQARAMKTEVNVQDGGPMPRGLGRLFRSMTGTRPRGGHPGKQVSARTADDLTLAPCLGEGAVNDRQ